VDVAASSWSRDAMRALVRRAGSQVNFIGFVTRDSGMPEDEFVLTRFIISCCVADALSVQVRVVGVPPGEFAEDQWVQVRGTFYPVGGEILVDASDVTAVPRPSHPYLNP
jgi:putative membrane protein